MDYREQGLDMLKARFAAWLAALAMATPAMAQTPPATAGGTSRVNVVKTVKDAGGWKLKVDGKDFFVFGMNWDYFPTGENYAYNFWGQPDDFIQKALDDEMSLMQKMGVNAVRMYAGVPPKWITYIYEKYGIYTILNHSMGRYGYNVDGVYLNPTNYADARTREVIKRDIVQLAQDFKNVPGMLMWLLGNENNYGLYWASAEIEDLPDMDQGDARAVFLYTLYGEITDAIHKVDDNHPVAIANGDLGFIDLIAKHVPNLDIMGSNVYRGPSSGDLFDVVQQKLDIPFVYTEFGSDAYNAKEDREDHLEQAEILRSLWQEIYEHSHGKGRAGNSIGGMTFQWIDGWWKYNQEVNLDVHDKTASWSNKAYMFDWTPDGNNMNEEWFGICAKSKTDEDGFYKAFPRSAYYVLQEGYKLDPYGVGVNLERIRQHWGAINATRVGTPYAAQALSEAVRNIEMIRSVNLTMQFETVTTDGTNLDAANAERAQSRFSHLESFYLDFEVQPASNVRGRASINVLGNAPRNPINQIFFENRILNKGTINTQILNNPLFVPDPRFVPQTAVQENLGIERVKLYQAEFDWSTSWFDMKGFYRKGHYHWAYEGDFFGLYQEANDQPNYDRFNADTPSGIEWTGKKWFDGLKIAFGPQLTWGANPTFIAKYYRKLGSWEFSAMHQEDVAQLSVAPTSSVFPVPKTRKTTLYIAKDFGPVKFEVGGIMAGTDRLDRDFTITEQVGTDACIESGAFNCGGYAGTGYEVQDDQIELLDTLGARGKLSFVYENFNLYVQGGFRGLVADSGWDQTTTFTGWSLKETGKGNNYNVIAGMALNVGDFQIAPNFMYQKPLIGPAAPIAPLYDVNSGRYFSAVGARNQLQDPFWVRENRETTGFELLLAYDPTPATWAWSWDSVIREDAGFAAWIDFVYRILPTSQDAGIGVSDAGFVFPFAAAPPAKNLWEVKGRMIMNPTSRTHIVINAYGGIGQPNGGVPRFTEDAETLENFERTITRVGGDFRLTYRNLNLEGFVKVNDWGPFDFHRDFNLTFPLQWRADVSYSLGTPAWFVRAFTRFGAAYYFRLNDEFSERIGNPNRDSYEWEFRTYVHISL